MSDNTLTLEISHGKNNYTINIPVTSTVANLKEKIQDQTQVPPSVQKLIIKGFKGKLEDSSVLETLNIKNNSKVMLIGSTLEKIISATTTTGVSADASSKKDPDTPQTPKPSEAKEHKKAIDKGKPADAEAAVKNQNHPLPKSIKGLLNKRGDPIRLTFKQELREMWIASKDSTEKVPYSSIRDVLTEPIHSDPDYSMIGLQTGQNLNSVYWIYFVPCQYVKSIKYGVLGGPSDPLTLFQ
ncbi:hypothetical protein AKO1_014466 [Acrasis kona]|uniref:Ubiquitin-like domain-containing protein n=1 Tax=Acrasis kona TaxID=1008807 RepID=A0AAW2Z051_9EUKA